MARSCAEASRTEEPGAEKLHAGVCTGGAGSRRSYRGGALTRRARVLQGRRKCHGKALKFAHIVYRTRRFEEMIAWYEEVFEARVQYKNPALAFLTYDDEHHRFAFGNLEVLDPAGKGSGGKADAGVDHVAYTYANLRDLIERTHGSRN